MMMIGMLIFWAVVILGIVWLVREGIGRAQRPREETPRADEETLLAILERRFAEGAISVEDYRTRRDVLGNGTVEPNGVHDEEPLTAPRAGGGSQS